ncbi:MAG TPA: methyltransferase domain-containing protein [Mycobacteriales bacterium]|nr:methyltransferase domain-containing protein [Mycobacteriales bacterium]
MRPSRAARMSLPPVLAAAAVRPGAPRRQRAAAAAALVALWGAVYSRYRREGMVVTARELELMGTATPDAFYRHYNECVPTVEEELDLWGAYHAHRHEMRYDLVARLVRQHVPPAGRVLDVGCGAALVADRVADLELCYVGLDYGAHHIAAAAAKVHGRDAPLRAGFVRGDGEHLPFPAETFDVVVLTEVIEHLMRPELATWEIARVLRPGGVLVMTTNNASEMPLASPASHLFAWLEKALGFRHDRLISHRPWVWPEPVARVILPEGSPEVYVPHTWHKQAETRRMFAAAGLETVHASSFEFPPPQSRTARWLEARGAPGRRVVDLIEAACGSVPLLNRLGCHVLMVARRVPGGAPFPPPGIWPGPFSG